MMYLDALRPDDAPQMIRLALANGQTAWTYTAGAHGIVVRDGDLIRGFCLLRETSAGFVVDELWADVPNGRRGKLALGMLARWLEAEMQRSADERSTIVKLGGIVRLDNPRHRRALTNRGFVPVAEVLAKEFYPT
jgi:hypothetical protein